MQALTGTELLGYVQLKVGSLDLKVPICAKPKATEESLALTPTAEFEVDGDAYAIVVQGDPSSAMMQEAVREAAEDAVVHLSRKLLN
jgi:hypothetical protein